MTRIGWWTTVGVIAGVAALGLAAPSSAQTTCDDGGLFDFDFSGTQYDNTNPPAAGCFRDVVRGGGINAGVDFGDGEDTALNITGAAAPGQRTWATVVDQNPSNGLADNLYESQFLCADILIQRGQNAKGAGVLALFNEGAGNKGLALLITNAGNTNRLVLGTVDGDPAKGGKFARLKRANLGPAEDAWYRLMMRLLVDEQVVIGQVFAHTDPSDPSSSLGAQVGKTLIYEPATFPVGVQASGESGVFGFAAGATPLNSSVTNFTNIFDPVNCFGSEPPPAD